MWFLVLGLAPISAADDQPAPQDSGLEERVEVQLVLIDVVVVERGGAPVAKLTADDFEVRVGRRRVELVSVDGGCAVDDLPADEPAADQTELPRSLRRLPGQTVHVFDYFHMEDAGRTLEQARDSVLAQSQPDERHMIISLSQALRIEQPFSTDTALLGDTLMRMRDDVGLYGGNHGRLTERRFFDRVRMLFEVLEQIPGRKAVVLYSGPFMNDGFTYDPMFRKLSSLAARARTAVYTVDAGGLRAPHDSSFMPLGGPLMLRRLANETGGRPTADTNDIGRGYARAQLDTACSYTLGFYDRFPIADRHRRLKVDMKQRGMRALHPAYYVVRSEEKRRRSLRSTAAMLPEMFDGQGLALSATPLNALEARWNVALEIDLEFPLEADAQGRQPRVHCIVRKPNGTVIRSFRRDLEDQRVREELKLKPGDYTVSAVLLTTQLDRPRAVTAQLQVPPLP